MKKLIKTKKFSRLITVMLVISVIASIFCVSASAASYNSATGTLNGYACKTTVSFATSSWALNGTTTYGTTASSVYIRLIYTFGIENTATTRTINDSKNNSNSSIAALTLSANAPADENISGSANGTITANNGKVWPSGTLRVS